MELTKQKDTNRLAFQNCNFVLNPVTSVDIQEIRMLFRKGINISNKSTYYIINISVRASGQGGGGGKKLDKVW